MKSEIYRDLSGYVRDFDLPPYEQIPDIGLYLEQTVKYVNACFAGFPDMQLTASMVSNYVKKGLISNPVKKLYRREQIAHLIFIAAAKLHTSIDNLSLMLLLQLSTYPTEVAYEYFRAELRNMLEYVFGLKELPELVGSMEMTEQKIMLRNAITAIAHKLYTELYLAELRKEMN